MSERHTSVSRRGVLVQRPGTRARTVVPLTTPLVLIGFRRPICAQINAEVYFGKFVVWFIAIVSKSQYVTVMPYGTL